MADGGKGKVRLSEGHSVSKSRKSINIVSFLVFIAVQHATANSVAYSNPCVLAPSSGSWNLAQCITRLQAELLSGDSGGQSLLPSSVVFCRIYFRAVVGLRCPFPCSHWPGIVLNS